MEPLTISAPVAGERKIVRVLSIDGGGIRGIVPALLLAEMERRTGRPVSRLFDLIAGTSTGGILALGLVRARAGTTTPAYKATDLADFYSELGPKIFSRDLWHQVRSGAGLFGSRYPSDGIEGVLEQFFGQARLKESLTPVFIPSYELEQKTPFFFRSLEAVKQSAYDFPMKVVARATSAAPTYFAPKTIAAGKAGNYVLVDGGLFANNPAACAFVEAKKVFPEAIDIRMVSLGTGAAQSTAIMTKACNWGLAQWAKPILNTVFDGVSSTVDYQMAQLLAPLSDGTERYFRIQPEISVKNQAMDDASSGNMKALREAAETTIQQQNELLNRLCGQLDSVTAGIAA